MSGPFARVVAPGPLTLVEDLGRPGVRRLGVARSGAFDRAALRAANRLVGNPDAAPGLEVTLGGLELELLAEVVLAVCGAHQPLMLAGEPTERDRPLRARAGAVLGVGPARAGVRGYLAVGGGLAVSGELGSASTDMFGGLGPPPLRAGDVLVAGALAGSGSGSGPHAPAPRSPPPTELTVTADPGPRADWFTPAAVERLYSTAWTVTPDSDRTALRLDGPVLDRAVRAELDPEPLARGAVQVPIAGRPLVFGPDHPVTGGYPVVAVVRDADTDALAQLRPGARLRFRRPAAG